MLFRRNIRKFVCSDRFEYLYIIMKRFLSAFYAITIFLISFASPLQWNGTTEKVISVPQAASTGLEEVVVLRSLQGISLSYMSSSPSSVKWYRYSNLGGGYLQEINEVTTSQDSSTLSSLDGDMGYIIEDGNSRYCFWLIDYSKYEFTASSLTPSPQQDCSEQVLNFSGTGNEIPYYTINGRRMVLDREISLSYLTLKPDSENVTFYDDTTILSLPSINEQIIVTPPYRNTSFILKGDRFLREWGAEVEIESTSVQAYAVSAVSKATQITTETDNQIGGSSGIALGGSAPCEIEFEAAVTDAAIFTEWQISRYNDFDVIDIRDPQLTLSHTFNEEGNTYVRFICANSDGACEYIGETYTVSIGTSDLRCPNAFSPNGDGVNDVWKVSYSSLIEFECHIFDRYGQKVFSFTDPSQGWDGMYKGKYVPTGVYYYVIKAKGADGKKYDRSGDINIINYE